MSTNGEPVLATSACTTYTQLFGRYQTAMKRWAKRRDDVCRMGPTGKESGGELCCLEAEFANAYAALYQHRRECSICSCARKVAHTYAEQASPRTPIQFKPNEARKQPTKIL